MTDQSQLQTLRHQIDQIDEKLLQLLNQRAELALAIGQTKLATSHNLPSTNFHYPDRENEILQHLSSANVGPLPKKSLEEIFRVIMKECLLLQKNLIAVRERTRS